MVKQRRRDGRIGEHIAEHGRHVRHDHARPLEDARDGNRRPVNLCGHPGALRIGVRRHEGTRARLPVCRSKLAMKLRQHFANKVRIGQRLPDHAGRGQEAGFFRYAQRLRHRRERRFILELARLAGEGIGIAGIGNDRPAMPAACFQCFATPFDVCRRRQRTCEHTCRRRAFRHQEEEDIIALYAPACIEAARRRRGLYAFDLWKLRKSLRRKW